MTLSIVRFGRMIKFSHTIFALPFALTAAVLASREHGMTWAQLGWIIGAMVGARTAAMGFNRIVDARIDAQNPRTAKREIPSGQISMIQASVFVVAAAFLLIVSAYFLNPLCFYLSPVALGVVFFYSYTKRFTAYSHVFLGLALALAPVGAWMAITGGWDTGAILIGLTVLAWVAGFDVIYACQDESFDRANALYSIPSRYGISRALWFSRTFHGLTSIGLIGIGYWFGLSWPYFAGSLVIIGILVYEQSLVKPTDLSKLNVAFFNMNGVISVLFLLSTIVAVYWT
jgi:4-hydroxybenzoate polyprenyltransferase